MGIVSKQALNNTIITYLGFGVAAVNTLFLYTNFLTDAYYGLVTVILSTSAVLMPLLAFGVPNTLVKFYSSFKKTGNTEAFETLMLLLPLLLIVPMALVTFVFTDAIGSFISKENGIVRNYVWYIFLIGFAMAYFEVFYAWAKVQMKSVFGNFMKEVFNRIGVMILLILVYFDSITVDFFLKALVGLYLLRTLIMKIYAYGLKMPKLNFDFPANTRAILSYSALIILGGSAAVIILEIDKVMINQYKLIENVAYYGVAIYIATTIIVPSRAMHQITYPLTAELLNNNDHEGLGSLYKKSSLTLFIASGLLFVLIITNLNDLFLVLPEEYRGGFAIVFLIGLAKVYDSVLGINNAILYNSDYYKTLLGMGVLLAVLVILLNILFIPKYGLYGAALATFIAISIYNTIKLFFVRAKFNIMPFTMETLKVGGLLLVLGGVFYMVNLPFHSLVNIVIKGTITTVLYLGVLYRFKISEDVYRMLSKYLKR
ncbi:polysaccharide biosynthesis C-terminal domain-containing protein [Maribacter sp. ANRC-HE7]|uniref:Polysaccharide biosynthesis C-terminal domain-containing protein n=1 Tax=Maribacter aquimaris TaxID=2737171 RepID=A0ABR7V1T0_9FLAO|nr:polysaccharide biosynthesis C-terminal domain-containing protein [Maribacter aquimaris]MBD0777661.1 polysaccharide biosynthesis C-terminal domain-containing protein [Maribacter aquimaris]